jgi:hypothetical protein
MSNSLITKKNYDYTIIGVILACHFLYLSGLSKLFIYEIYDYYLEVGNTFHDFFWYPSYALIKKINVFDQFRNAIPTAYPSGHPAPNYSILHTIIFTPFGLLNYNLSKIFYLLTNLILLFFIYKQLKKFSLKNNNLIFFLFCSFLFSPALILCLKNGQYTIFCLWGFLFFFTSNNNLFKFTGILIATGKYTFAPIIGFYLLCEKKFTMLLFLIFANIMAVLFYSIYFDISFVSALVNPILMGWTTQAMGSGDLLSFLGNNPKFPFNIIIVLLAFFLLKYFIYFNTIRSKIFDFVIISILTLMSLKHLSYDYIFIFPTILLLFEKINFRLKIILSIIIFYFLIILPWQIIEPIRYTKYFIFFNFSLNIILLLIALQSVLVNKYLNILYRKMK